MSDLDRTVRDLVIANRILANEDVVGAYGHVSVRHPADSGRYLLARSVVPELWRPAISSSSPSTARRRRGKR